jgi:hypothetical protein
MEGVTSHGSSSLMDDSNDVQQQQQQQQQTQPLQGIIPRAFRQIFRNINYSQNKKVNFKNIYIRI